MNIQSYPTYHTKEEDFKFEKNYIPIAKKELEKIFTILHKPSKKVMAKAFHRGTRTKVYPKGKVYGTKCFIKYSA